VKCAHWKLVERLSYSLIKFKAQDKVDFQTNK
jgi:hypothetical protein